MGLFKGRRIPPDQLTPAGSRASTACSWSRKKEHEAPPPTSENLPSETVWKIQIGCETELRKRQKGVDRILIGRFLLPKKLFGYFPNSFSTHSGE
jgi:hypothetical protein